MNKAIYFDMDGTVAELYKVADWLPKLRSEDASPYAEAEPKVNLQELAETLEALKSLGYTIGVITWLGMRASKQYKQATRQAKAEWLKKIPFTFDEIHMVQYGTPKHKIAKIKNSVLVDDNKDVREAWEKSGGATINAEPENWLAELKGLVKDNG
jgi:hypothetical protein